MTCLTSPTKAYNYFSFFYPRPDGTLLTRIESVNKCLSNRGKRVELKENKYREIVVPCPAKQKHVLRPQGYMFVYVVCDTTIQHANSQEYVWLQPSMSIYICQTKFKHNFLINHHQNHFTQL